MPEANQQDLERIRKRIIADYNRGKKPKWLSENYGVNINTVKSWIKRGAPPKKGAGKKVQKDAPKRAPGASRGGAPKGNTNAVGGRGGAGGPVGNTNAMKHGGYSPAYWDTLTEEEQRMLTDAEYDGEQLLLDEIALLSIRERRIMARIRYFQEKESKMEVSAIIRSEEKREFSSEEERAEYEYRIQAKVESGECMPGTTYRRTTQTEATYDIVHRLEEALTRCQAQKQKCIQSLNELRRQRGDGGLDALQKLDEVLAQIEGVDNVVQ